MEVSGVGPGFKHLGLAPILILVLTRLVAGLAGTIRLADEGTVALALELVPPPLAVLAAGLGAMALRLSSDLLLRRSLVHNLTPLLG